MRGLRERRWWLPAAATLAALSRPALAQDVDLNSVHWAYSSYFGTGWYTVSDNRDVYVIRITPRWETREALLEDGRRQVGVEWRLPVTIGLNSFDIEDPVGTVDPDNLASLSVSPGVDLIVPVTDRWTLRPFASIGWGTILGEEDDAWTYWAGVKSNVAFRSGKLDWNLVNSVGFVGYKPNGGTSEDFWPVTAGLEFEYPLGSRRMGDDPLFIAWHGMYTTFENNLDLTAGVASPDVQPPEPITDQWEFGVALGKRGERFGFWMLRFDRLGLAYRVSSTGAFKGISVVFRSVFER